ncbi:hypothetical protein TNIN_372651 [Trichonephila inaurata madagascariensis]|uniref:Uncharacterized protein n=1 Tax=Trichonephila inaurata madagascariensis TaxID=2747483 RepID=A0A8X7C0Q9_9ARAC|nr:hypothetical protein TNIN_372651 [Trichonephila inaurata madagascariensis]
MNVAANLYGRVSFAKKGSVVLHSNAAVSSVWTTHHFADINEDRDLNKAAESPVGNARETIGFARGQEVNRKIIVTDRISPEVIKVDNSSFI